MNNKLILKGWLKYTYYKGLMLFSEKDEDPYDLDNVEDCIIIDEIENFLKGGNGSYVLYIVSEKMDIEDIKENYLKKMYGSGKIEIDSYVKTCIYGTCIEVIEKCIIGGHNLQNELYSYCDENNYIYLEINKILK